MRKKYRVVGIMSGSSLDALDITICDFVLNKSDSSTPLQIEYFPLCTHEVPLSSAFRNQLKYWRLLTMEELLAFEVVFTQWMGNAVKRILDSNKMDVDFVSSHGHTLLHKPDLGFTWQIGHGSTLAAIVGKPVVYDFRQKDVALGGQGAPMVSIAETYLWPAYDAFLNLGGIANISLHNIEKPIAWDICGCNQLLNALSELVEKDYDKGGIIASHGQLLETLYHELLASPYHFRKTPKSLDNNFVQNEILSVILKHTGSVSDKMYTVCKYIASSIARDLKAFTLPKKLMVTGGGSFNDFLVNCIRSELEPLSLEIILPNEETIRYKEAIMVALCGVLRWNNLQNFQSSVTGAREDAIGGVIAL